MQTLTNASFSSVESDRLSRHAGHTNKVLEWHQVPALGPFLDSRLTLFQEPLLRIGYDPPSDWFGQDEPFFGGIMQLVINK